MINRIGRRAPQIHLPFHLRFMYPYRRGTVLSVYIAAVRDPPPTAPNGAKPVGRSLLYLSLSRPFPLVNYRATVWTDRLVPRGRVET